MLGKWLERLTPEQEDRLLTQVLVPFIDLRPEGGGCLVGVAFGAHECRTRWERWSFAPGHIPVPRLTTGYFSTSPGARFNHLCQRLVGLLGSSRVDFSHYIGSQGQLEGGARAAVLIRNRILRNRAKRALVGVPQQEVEASVRA